MNICLHEFEVKGILDGMITELWRPIKNRKEDDIKLVNLCNGLAQWQSEGGFGCGYEKSPFGPVGTRITGYAANGTFYYKTTDKPEHCPWNSPIVMPSRVSRITLINTGVECKRVSTITWVEMKAAGFEAVEEFDGCFAEVWNQYNPKYPFESAYGWKLKFETEAKR